MKSQVLLETKTPLELQDRAPLQPANGEVIVNIRAAALNRRDYWITQGMYPGIKLPCVPGSDGAGVVSGAESVGEAVEGDWLDAEVIMNPGLDWGGSHRSQAGDFRILGMPDDGTFAEQVAIPAAYLHRKPAHLSWHQAAALPLAGLTAYRAVMVQGQVEKDQVVLVTGIGGGVAGFALQFAKAAGATVIVTSSSEQKLERAKTLGAAAGFDYRQPDWHESLLKEIGPVDVVIDSAAGSGYANLVAAAKFGGRIVNYGATTGPPEKLDMFSVFWKQLTLQGTTMGSPGDFAAMLKFVDEHKIVPVVDEVFPLADADAALQRMAEGKQFGKIVLSI